MVSSWTVVCWWTKAPTTSSSLFLLEAPPTCELDAAAFTEPFADMEPVCSV